MYGLFYILTNISDILTDTPLLVIIEIMAYEPLCV
jgi:hypothetical protein